MKSLFHCNRSASGINQRFPNSNKRHAVSLVVTVNLPPPAPAWTFELDIRPFGEAGNSV